MHRQKPVMDALLEAFKLALEVYLSIKSRLVSIKSHHDRYCSHKRNGSTFICSTAALIDPTHETQINFSEMWIRKVGLAPSVASSIAGTFLEKPLNLFVNVGLSPLPYHDLLSSIDSVHVALALHFALSPSPPQLLLPIQSSNSTPPP